MLKNNKQKNGGAQIDLFVGVSFAELKICMGHRRCVLGGDLS